MKITDRIKDLLTVAAIAIMLPSCGSEAQRRVDTMVEEQNASCPIEIYGGVAVEKVSRSGDMVVYDVKVDEHLQVRQLSENSEAARSLVADAIAGSDSPEVREELEACRDAGVKMKYLLTDEKGDTFSIVIDPADYLK